MQWLASLTETPVDSWSYLGPFGAATAIAVAVIGRLWKELADTRRRVVEVEDTRLALAERTLPVLQRSTEALEEATRLLVEISVQQRRGDWP